MKSKAGHYSARVGVATALALAARAFFAAVAMAIPFSPDSPDSLAPETAAAGVDLLWSVNAATVTLTATDGGSGVAATYYRIDINGAEGTWRTWVYDSGLRVGSRRHRPVSGVYTVNHYSVDNANNVETTKTVSVIVDSTAPSTSDDSDGLPHSGDTVVNFGATDAHGGVAATYFSTDQGQSWVASSQATIPGSSLGINTVMYYSVDTAGNVERTPTTSVEIVEGGGASLVADSGVQTISAPPDGLCAAGHADRHGHRGPRNHPGRLHH